MKKNNLTIIFSLVIISVVCVLVLLILLFIPKSAARLPEKTEADNLIAANQSALNINQETKRKEVSPIGKDDHIMGKSDAPVQLIVYSDFECPACLQFLDSLKKVREAYGDEVAIAYRHYPLGMHSLARPAAEASECAAEQGKFWEMHDLIFADNKNNILSTEQFKSDAKKLGLDQIRFNNCLETGKYKDKVVMQMAEGKLVGVSGTPSVFINKKLLPGAYPYEDFTDSNGTERSGIKSVIDEALGRNK